MAMDQRRALLSPVLEDKHPVLPVAPALTVHVEIQFTDPVIRSRYTRTYGSSPKFKHTPRIRRGLLRRIERCSEELITRKDSGALDVLKDGTFERKPLRYEMAFRIVTRERGEYAERTYRSYQKQPLTVGATKDIILASHRIVGLFLRRHDQGFKWLDGAVRDSSLEGPQTTSPSVDGPLSLLCVPGSRFIESTQQFEHIPGYAVEVSFRSRNPLRRVPVFGKTLRINSEQTAPLTSDMCEDVLWRGLNAINGALEPRKQQFDLHSRNCWEGDCRHSDDDALSIEIRVANNLGPDWYAHRSVQSRLLLFRDPEARDCEDFLQTVGAKLSSIRNESDAKINDLDDFEFRIRELRGYGWSVREPARFSRGPSSSYGRRTIQAALDRIQTGITDVLRGHDVAIHISARKRGHVILDKAIVARAKHGVTREIFASPKDAQETFVSRLQARLEQEIDKVFADTCSIDDLPDEEEEPPPRPLSASTIVESEPPSPQKRMPGEPPSVPTTPVKSPRLQRMFSLSGRSPSVRSVGSISDFKASGDPFESYGSKTASVVSEDASETAFSWAGEERPPMVSFSPIKPAQRRFPLISPRRNTSWTGRVSNASTLIEEIPVDMNPTHEDAVRAVDLEKDGFDGDALHAVTSGATEGEGAHSDARIVPAVGFKASVVDRCLPIAEPQSICAANMDSPPDAVFVDAAEFAAAVPSPGVAGVVDIFSTAPSTPGLSMGESPGGGNSAFITTSLTVAGREPTDAERDTTAMTEGSRWGGVAIKVAAEIDAAGASGGSTAGKEKYDIDTTMSTTSTTSTATSLLSPAPEIMAAPIETESPALLWGVLRSADPTPVDLKVVEPEVSEPKVAEVHIVDPAPAPATAEPVDAADPRIAEPVAMVSDVQVSGAPATLWGLLDKTEPVVAAVQVPETEVAEVQSREISKPELESIAQPVEAPQDEKVVKPKVVEAAAEPIAIPQIQTRQPPTADVDDAASGSPTNLWGLLQQSETKASEPEAQERGIEVEPEPVSAPQPVVLVPEPTVEAAQEPERIVEAEPEKPVRDEKADEAEAPSHQVEGTSEPGTGGADPGTIVSAVQEPEPGVVGALPAEPEIEEADKTIDTEPVVEHVAAPAPEPPVEIQVEEVAKEETTAVPEVIEADKEPEQPETPANKTEDAPEPEPVAEQVPEDVVAPAPERSEPEIHETPAVSEDKIEEAPIAKEVVDEASKAEKTPEEPAIDKAEIVEETPAVADVAEAADAPKVVNEDPAVAQPVEVVEQVKESSEKTEAEPVVEKAPEVTLEETAPEVPEVQARSAVPEPEVIEEKAQEVIPEPTSNKVDVEPTVESAAEVIPEVAPVVEAPVAAEPAVETLPVAEITPAVEAPVVEAEPVKTAQMTEETAPVVEAPAAEAPATTEAPVAEAEPVVETAPAVEETAPTAEVPAVEAEPVVETAPAVEKAVVDEVPVVDSTTISQTPIESLPTEETVTVAPKLEVTRSVPAETSDDKAVDAPAVEETPAKEVEIQSAVVDKLEQVEEREVEAVVAGTHEPVPSPVAEPVEEVVPVKETVPVQEVAPVHEAAPVQETVPTPEVPAVVAAEATEAPVEAPVQEKEVPAAAKAVEPVEVGQDAVQKEDTMVADAEAAEKALQQDALELFDSAETRERGETLVDHDVRETIADSPDPEQQPTRAVPETVIEVSAPTTDSKAPERQAPTADPNPPLLISADSGSDLENITPQLSSTKSLRPDISVQDFAPPTAKPLLSPVSNPHYLTPSPRTSTSSWTSLETRGSVDTLRSKDEPVAIPEETKTAPQTAGLLGLHTDNKTLDLGLRGALGKQNAQALEGKRPAAEDSTSPVKRRKLEEIEEQVYQGPSVLPKVMMLLAGAVAIGKVWKGFSR